MLLVCPSCSSAFRIDAKALGAEGRSVRCGQCRTVWHASPADARPEPETASASAETRSAAVTPPPPPAAEPPAEDWGAGFSDEATNNSQPAPEPHTEPEPAIAEAMSAPPAPPSDEPPHVAAPALVPDNSLEVLATRRSRRPVGPAPRKKAPREPFYKSLSPSKLVVIGCVISIMLIVANRTTIVRHWPDTAEIFEAFGLRVNLRGLDFQDITTQREVQDGVAVLTITGNIVNQSRYTTDIPKLRFSVRDAGGREIYTWTAAPQKPLLESGEVLQFRSRLASPPPEGRDVMVRFLTRKDLGQ